MGKSLGNLLGDLIVSHRAIEGGLRLNPSSYVWYPAMDWSNWRVTIALQVAPLDAYIPWEPLSAAIPHEPQHE